MKKLFAAEQFVDFDTKNGDSAVDKAKFANHFVRFVESDFKETLFPKWFYNRLSMTFGHIAHFNQGGFYATFFASTRDKVEFLRQTINPWTHFAGDPHFTYVDVERKLAEWVKAEGLLEKYQKQLEEDVERHERAELARLQAKYSV